MRAISLFSGVGGFEIGFERAGIQTVLQAEQDPWCLEVLARHWPEVERVTDVRQVDKAALQGRRRDMDGNESGPDSQWSGGTARNTADVDHRTDGVQPTSNHAQQRRVGRKLQAGHDPRFFDSEPAAKGSAIDLIYGGFPCQDVSVAGKRAGLSGDRSGLWHEFHRVLRELRPRWTAIENVPGLLSSNSGRDFATIPLGLEELGYGWAYRILDARWFAVPQRRRRVFIVGCLADAARAAQVLAVCESCGGYPQTRPETREGIAPGTADGVAIPLNARRGIGWPDVMNYVTGTLGASDLTGEANEASFLVAGALRASDGHHGHSSPRGDGSDTLIAFHATQDPITSTECRTALGGNAYIGVTAFDWQASAGNDDSWRGKGRQHVVRSGDYAGANSATRVDAVAGTFGVRRLTPLECNRLQGFPDDWDRWTAGGNEIADSHRYRMMGNAVCVPVCEWIGHRLVFVDRMLEPLP